MALPAPVPAPRPAPLALPAPTPPPAPVAAPAAAPRIPAAVAAVAPTAAGAAPRLDDKLVEQIFSCLAPGLPQDWKRTWVVVANAQDAVAAKFYVTTSYRDEDAEEFVPCNVQEITRRITGLGNTQSPERRWKSVRLTINTEGEYELKYDYGK
jgi:hypothetical protein